MSFIETRLLDKASYGFQGGPEFRTRVVSLDSGRERRNAQWTRPRHRYTASYDRLRPEDYEVVRAAFYACMGQAYGFRYGDPFDFAAEDELVGLGDGTRVAFQLVKAYTFGPASYTRTITKPRAGVVMKVNGSAVSATVNTATGIATLAAPPAGAAVVRWSGEFDVPVRFASDFFPTSYDEFEALSGSVDLLELL